MRLSLICPRCETPFWRDVTPDTPSIDCPNCDWSRSVSAVDVEGGVPKRCLACGCEDLWRQKDFPQRLGVLFVAIGAILSTVAWFYYNPLWAYGILGAFALCDLLLYILMSDVLVCYRCRAMHRRTAIDEAHPRFDLEVAERYRQEALRIKRTS